MLTYFLGPFLAMLPRRWQKALPFSGAIQWNRAGAVSGLLESLLALLAMLFWYQHTAMRWIEHAAGEAADGKMGPEVNPYAIGFAAWALLVVHPLTWLLFYFMLEGAVRFSSAAFSGGVSGILPLAIVDSLFRKLSGASGDPLRSAEAKPAFSSISSSVKEKILTSTISAGADELHFLKNDEQEILEIHASRRKDDWTPPRVVRFEDKYYRLEECKSGRTPRPFVYVLRRLAAGVPGRNVILYSPEAEPQSKR